MNTPNLTPAKADDFWREASCFGCPSSISLPATKDEASGSWAGRLVFPVNRGPLLGGGYVVYTYYSGPKAGTQEYFTYRECVHEFEAKSLGRCWTAYTCKKCHARYDVDSSD